MPAPGREPAQADLFKDNPLFDKIKTIDLDSTSPRQALALLYEIQAMLADRPGPELPPSFSNQAQYPDKQTD